MKRLVALPAVAGMVVAGFALGVPAATAHTPNVSATCSGVTGSGTAYGKGGATITVSVDTNEQSKQIGDAGSLTVEVPQDYQVHKWSVQVEAPGTQYDLFKQGTVGPCGEKPQPDQPPALVESVPETNAPDCDARTVTTVTTTTTTPYVWDEKSWTWVTGEPVVTTETTSREATDEECVPPVVIPPKPADQVEPFEKSTTDCDTDTVTTEHWTITRAYVYKEDTNTWSLGPAGDPVFGEPTTVEATDEQCPVVVVPPAETPPVVTPPVVTPPVVTPPVVTPPVIAPPVVAPPAVVAPQAVVPVLKAPVAKAPVKAAHLAYTGFDAAVWGYSAIGLLIAGGIAIFAGTRKRDQS